MNFNCLRGEILDTNFAVTKLHKFFGFKHEGVLRDYLYDPHTKEYVNLIIMSILKKEWQNNKKNIDKNMQLLF